MSNTSQLTELIAQANLLIEKIKEHPQYKMLDFHGDVNAADAQHFLTELACELQAHTNVDIQQFEGFLQ